VEADVRYAIGSQVPLPVVVRDGGGTAVDATSVTISVFFPDGTASTVFTTPGTVAHSGTGTYVAYYVPTLVGRHTWTASTTGPVTALQPDSFHVVAATDAPLVSLADIRTHLGSGTTASDLQLYDFAARSTDACEQFTNRAWRRKTVVEVSDGGGIAILLRRQPVISVTTVVENGTTLGVADYTAKPLSGQVFRGGPLTRLRWWPGIQTVAITYVVGPAGDIVPDDVTGGVLEMIRHLMASQRGGTNLPRQSSDDAWAPGAGYSIPRWVAQLWQPYAMPPVSGF
jgi:hypothetical protein